MSDEDYQSSNESSDDDLNGNRHDYSGAFITNERFETREAAAKWAKEIALINRFELVISSHKKDGRRIVMKCNRGTPYKRVERNPDESVRRRKSKTTKCGCLFLLWLVMKKDNDELFWEIQTFPGEKGMHNHRMIKHAEGHRQLSALSHKAKIIIEDMTKAQCKPGHTLAGVQEACPEDYAHISLIYNHKVFLRAQALAGRNVYQQMLFRAEQENYTVSQVGNAATYELTHVFMAHPHGKRLFQIYYWTIGLDSTYKTNKYKWPLVQMIGMTPCNKNFLIAYALMENENTESYEWALQRLKDLLPKGKLPTSISTDRELGLVKALTQVFPNIPHLLCTWHINKDVEAHVAVLVDKPFASTFKTGRWKNIISASTVEAYRRNVNSLRECGHSSVVKYVQQTWLVHKEKFVHAWVNEVFHLGNTTTCRVESAHSSTKSWLHTSTGALDSVWEKIHSKILNEHTEIRKTNEDSIRRHPTIRLGKPLTYINRHVSHYCIELLEKEHNKMKKYADKSNDLCKHVLRTTLGLPCACEMYQALISGTEIHMADIHAFWSTLTILVEDEPKHDVGPGVRSDEHRYMDSLVDELDGMDPEVVGQTTRKMHINWWVQHG